LIATYGKETLEEVFLDVVRGRARQDTDRLGRGTEPERKAS
jgi:hypothetical protein